MKRLVLIVLACCAVVPANAEFMSYSTLARLSDNARHAYIAGAYDSYSTLLYYDRSDAVKHFDSCISRTNMTNGQLADNVFAFIKARPNLHTFPVSASMIQYLNEACGPVPKS